MKDECLKSFPDLADMVYEENQRQLSKWGIQDRSPFEWLTYTMEELGETAEATSEYYYRRGPSTAVVKEAIQAATLCLKIAEMFLNLNESPPIYERNHHGTM